jgi:hypothetical protein
MKTIRIVRLLLVAFVATRFAAATAHAAIVWNGPLITFEKLDFTDWTLPANQDQITPIVSLTRASSQGLFNIVAESFYTKEMSPSGTEWAFGTTVNYLTLTYKNWEAWAGKNPPATVGQSAVLHLIQEDIYIDIKFTSWGGSGTAGAFSYERSTIPEPASVFLLGAAAAMLSARRWRRA